MHKKLLALILAALVILGGLYSAVTAQPAPEPESTAPATVATGEIAATEEDTQPPPSTEAEAKPSGTLIEIDGHYDSMKDVSMYIHLFGRLPDNYLTKSEARALGWSGGSVERYAPGCCIGGDTFRNNEGQLPDAPGRKWTECDIDTLGQSSRGAKRIVFSNDGLIYYTEDHYDTFELLYGEP